jgi:hypothetical protein
MSPGSRLRRDSCWWNSRDHADLLSIQLFRSSANQGHGVSAVWASTTRRKSCYSRHETFSAVSWAREPPRRRQTYNLACLAVRRGRRDEAFSLLREAMQHGLSPAQALGIETDPDLKALHEDAPPRSTSVFSNFLQSRLSSGWKRRVRLVTRATWK